MYANIDRVDTESLPLRGTSQTRYACAICVHPFLFAFICVKTLLACPKARTTPGSHRDPARKRPRPRPEYPNGDRAPWSRPRSCLVAAAWLRCLESFAFLLARLCRILVSLLACVHPRRPRTFTPSAGDA